MKRLGTCPCCAAVKWEMSLLRNGYGHHVCGHGLGTMCMCMCSTPFGCVVFCLMLLCLVMFYVLCFDFDLRCLSFVMDLWLSGSMLHASVFRVAWICVMSLRFVLTSCGLLVQLAVIASGNSRSSCSSRSSGNSRSSCSSRSSSRRSDRKSRAVEVAGSAAA